MTCFVDAAWLRDAAAICTAAIEDMERQIDRLTPFVAPYVAESKYEVPMAHLRARLETLITHEAALRRAILALPPGGAVAIGAETLEWADAMRAHPLRKER
jgi:hypothetical protein